MGCFEDIEHNDNIPKVIHVIAYTEKDNMFKVNTQNYITANSYYASEYNYRPNRCKGEIKLPTNSTLFISNKENFNGIVLISRGTPYYNNVRGSDKKIMSRDQYFILEKDVQVYYGNFSKFRCDLHYFDPNDTLETEKIEEHSEYQ